jgi:hypothetical protein
MSLVQNTSSSTDLASLINTETTASEVQSEIVVPLPSAGDAFWGDNPSILFEKDRLVEFFPTADQTVPERMNAISRLIIYISIVLSIYQSRANAIHFGVLLLAMVYIMWKNSSLGNIKNAVLSTASPLTESTEHFGDGDTADRCYGPTPQNPYMNYLLGDVPGRDRACQGPGVQEQAANLLDKQLFTDVDDLFSKNANQRLFRTMPETSGVPDREKFANWLFSGEKGCKTDGECPPQFEDLRLARQLIPSDLDKNNNFNVEGYNL